MGKKTDYQKVQHVIEELNKVMEPIHNKIREMLETGELTPDMLDFDYYAEEEDLEASFVIAYKGGAKALMTRNFKVEIQIEIRESVC